MNTARLKTVKYRIIGSLCVTLGMILSGLNEVIVKVSGLSTEQLVTGRFSIQLIIATLWWNIKKPISPHLFHSDSNKVLINNWYGDKPFIINIWLRGIFFAGLIFLFYFSSVNYKHDII